MAPLAAALVLLLAAAATVESCPHGNHGPRAHHALNRRATTCGTSATSKFFSSSFSGTYNTISSNTCPGYDWTGQKTPNTCYATCKTYNYPSTVRINSSPLYIGVYTDLAQTKSNANPVMGPVGVAINGVPLFGNSDALKRDAYKYEGTSFDAAQGHCSPEGEYHYHTLPTNGYVITNTAGQHSPLLGVMKDGIPIFGELGDNGVVPTDLDECNMHVDKSYPFPHYHATANLKYPYLVNCLRGCVDGSTCNSNGTTWNMADKISTLLKSVSSAGTCASPGVVATTAAPKATTAAVKPTTAAAVKATTAAPKPSSVLPLRITTRAAVLPTTRKPVPTTMKLRPDPFPRPGPGGPLPPPPKRQ